MVIQYCHLSFKWIYFKLHAFQTKYNCFIFCFVVVFLYIISKIKCINKFKLNNNQKNNIVFFNWMKLFIFKLDSGTNSRKNEEVCILRRTRLAEQTINSAKRVPRYVINQNMMNEHLILETILLEFKCY